MDRRVPTTGSEEIELYMRTYYSLLRSSDSIKIETLVESHLAMASSLHDRADRRRTRCLRLDVQRLAFACVHYSSRGDL